MFLFLFCALGLAEPLYVQASVLNARSAPEEGAAIEAWLRIGTPVEVLQERGPWLEVTLVGRPDAHPVRGWVLGEYLDTTAPTEDSIVQGRKKALRTGNPDAIRSWTDRSNALRGGLVEGPNHVAVCDGERVDYIGYFDEKGDFVDRGTWEAPRQDLMDLSALHWTRTTPQGASSAIGGSPFARPFATDRWNEERPSPWTPGSCTGICDGVAHVVLGPCEVAGAVFTSHPAPSGIRSWVEDTHTDEIRAWEHGDYRRSLWKVETQDWTATLTLDETEMGDTSPAPARPTTWIGGQESGFGVAPIHDRSTRGWLVVEVERASFRYTRVLVEGWGC